MFSAASALSCLGVLCTTFAPALVLVITTMQQEPMLMVLGIFAAFIWACAISVVAVVWVLLVPLRSVLWLLLLYAVALQELARWVTYALFDRFMRGLKSTGLLPTDRWRTAVQVVPAALASGLGTGVMQVLVMHGDVLAGSLRPGTLYAPACSSLSVFAVDALTNCAIIGLNVLLSILGWTTAYPRGSKPLWAAMVGLHTLFAFATLLNTQLPALVAPGDGCTLALPGLYAVVTLTAVLTARVAFTSVCAPRLAEGGAPVVAGTSGTSPRADART